MTVPPLPREVRRAFDAYPAPICRRLLEVRNLIFATAKASCSVSTKPSEPGGVGTPAFLASVRLMALS